MLHRLPDEIRELGRTPLFRDLSMRELDVVQRLGTVIDRGAGELLCPRGQSAGQIGVIVSGEVAATTAGGRRRHLRDGDCFGTLGRPHDTEPEEIETVTRVTLFIVSRRELSTIRSVCPRLAARLAGVHDVAPEPARPPLAGAWPSYPVPVTT
jgi:CRP-like cAMP-binding protein